MEFGNQVPISSHRKLLWSNAMGPEDAPRAPGTVIVRERDQKSHGVVTMADGFARNRQTFDRLSQVVFSISGTRRNGPATSDREIGGSR
jgi:hypothetical protein